MTVPIEMSLEDEILETLGICGCGQPRDVMELVERSLTRMSSVGRAAANNEDYRLGLQRAFRRENALDDPLVWAHFYQMDHLGLIEHGVSVWCGWTTPKGEAVLALLRKYLAEGAKDG